MTTVKELIEILKTLNQDDIVILSSDPEGNSYSPIHPGVEIDMKYAGGQVRPAKLTDHHRKLGYTEEDLFDPVFDYEYDPVPVSCICLYPKFH